MTKPVIRDFAAKRGDLVLVAYRKRSFAIGKGASESEHYEIERVTSVGRDGQIKATQRAHRFGESTSVNDEPLYRMQTSHGHQHRSYRLYYERCWTIPANTCDVDAAWSAVCERQDAPTSWAPTRFDDIESAKEYMRSFLLVAA